MKAICLGLECCTRTIKKRCIETEENLLFGLNGFQYKFVQIKNRPYSQLNGLKTTNRGSLSLITDSHYSVSRIKLGFNLLFFFWLISANLKITKLVIMVRLRMLPTAVVLPANCPLPATTTTIVRNIKDKGRLHFIAYMDTVI